MEILENGTDCQRKAENGDIIRIYGLGLGERNKLFLSSIVTNYFKNLNEK